MFWILLATTLYSVQTQKNAAKTQEIELESQKDQERIAGEGRELARRERLNKVLSQSIAAQSQSGISGEGTPQSIALGNAKTASLSEGLESLSEKLRQAQLTRKARQAGKQGDIAAASTLLKSGMQMGEIQ